MATLVSVFCILASFILAESAKDVQHSLDIDLAKEKKNKCLYADTPPSSNRHTTRKLF